MNSKSTFIKGEIILKHIFIINPAAGKKDSSEDLIPQIERAAAEIGIDYEIVLTQGRLHATKICEEYAQKYEAVRFYACGGDGTLNEVVTGAYKYPGAEIAIVPCGSGNDFVRVFGNADAFKDIKRIICGDKLKCDIIKAGKKVSINICSVGFDAAVAYGIYKYRRIPIINGEMGYNVSVLEQLLLPLGNLLTMEIDGQKTEGNYLLVCIANGRYYGGGYNGAPNAKINDGLLDLILVKKISRLKIARVIALYKAGKHLQDGEVIPELKDIIEYKRCKSINITSVKKFIYNIDGECAPGTKFELEVLPHAVTLVLPVGVV